MHTMHPASLLASSHLLTAILHLLTVVLTAATSEDLSLAASFLRADSLRQRAHLLVDRHCYSSIFSELLRLP